MRKEIKFTIEESQQWSSDVLVKGVIKHNGEIHRFSMYGRIEEIDRMKKRIIKALGQNITTLLKQKKRKKDIADIVGITYEEHDVIIEGE